MNEVISERSGSILRIQLNRPEKKNAMTLAMYTALADLLEAAGKDERVRVVILHGAGDSFTAGDDLQDFAANHPGPGERPPMRLFAALLRFEKPIVAAVHGMAIGFGTTGLLHCDFVYAGESAKFKMPFIELALVPDFGSTRLIPTRVGYLQAAELIFLGTPFDATRAVQLGIATAVVPDGELLEKATQTAQKFAEKAPEALRACKKLLKGPVREQVEKAARAEADELTSRLRGGLS